MGGDDVVSVLAQFIRDGVRFISTQSDGAFLMAAATRVASDLRRVAGETE